GDYIVHIDGDDFVMIDYIEKLLARALETKADIVLGSFIDYNETDGEKHIINTLRSVGYDEIIKGTDEIISKLVSRDNYFWEMWGKIYKRSVMISALKHLDKIDRHIIM